MEPNRIKQMWRENRPVAVAWLTLGEPHAAELLAHQGFDAIVIDMQHGIGVTPDRAIACIRAINTTNTVPFVRVPWNEPVHFQYVLDAGALGVIVPLVNSPAEAARAAGACRYPPLGYRSIGPNRVTFANPDYYARANDEVICLVMIEHIKAVEQIDAIAQTAGIDGFYIGPGDLGISLGIGPDATGDARHIAASRQTLEAARRHGLVAGFHPSGPADARQRISEGYQFCPCGGDWEFLLSGSAEALATFRAG
jgi:4-hydroxy-2-oxoheptanedioate aldolase